MSPKRKQTEIKEEVLRYIADHRGEIDITKCAKDLGLSEAEVIETIGILQGEGRIEREKVGPPPKPAPPRKKPPAKPAQPKGKPAPSKPREKPAPPKKKPTLPEKKPPRVAPPEPKGGGRQVTQQIRLICPNCFKYECKEFKCSHCGHVVTFPRAGSPLPICPRCKKGVFKIHWYGYEWLECDNCGKESRINKWILAGRA